MPTNSTKQRGADWGAKRTQPQAQQSAVNESDARDSAPEPGSTEIQGRAWLTASLVILGVAAFLRLWVLELKPMHHDEGVNGFFLTSLVQHGLYKYDPSNYHGPTLYYLTLPLAHVFGLNSFVVRLVPALFGIAIVWLVLCLRRYTGALAALAAAALIAVSPGAIYQARYFIHETLFVFFTLAVVVAALCYYDRRRPGWGGVSAITGVVFTLFFSITHYASKAVADEFFKESANPDTLFKVYLGVALFSASALTFAAVSLLLRHDEGRTVHLLLAAASAALMFATKETAFISAVVLVLATLVARVWVRYMQPTWREQPARGGERKRRKNAAARDYRQESLLARFGGANRALTLLLCALALFLFVNIVFYSSFFTYAGGIGGAVESLKIWTKTGTKEHAKDTHTYLLWLLQEEAPTLILAVIGAAWALFERFRNRFAIFAGAWAFGILAAYSLIPYKTPWLMLNFTVPLAIAGGYAVQALSRVRGLKSRQAMTLALAVAGVAVAVSAYQAVVLNFRQYDNDKYPYVYSHTTRQIHEVLRVIDAEAERTGKGNEMSVGIYSEDYWPMPWYLRDYRNVSYAGRIGAWTEQVVIVKETQLPQISQQLQTAPGNAYQRVGNFYELRPGVRLALYVRR